MDPQLKKRCDTAIQLLSWQSEDAYGDTVYANPVPYTCFKVDKISTVKNYMGEDVISTFKLFFDGILPLNAKDKMIIGGIKYPIKAFSQYKGLKPNTGTTEVYL